MKKILLSLLAVVVSATAFAIPTLAPSPGVVKTQASDDAGANIAQGGLASICIMVGNGVVNRDCEGFAVLYKDGKQVVSVPASNEKRVYCEEGFTSHLEQGDVRINFWSGSNSTLNPYNKNGNYTVVIPSDFYRVNGVGNQPFTADFTINDNAAPAYTVTASPAAGNVETLSTVTLTFDVATALNVTDSEGIYFIDPYEATKEFDSDSGSYITSYKTKVFPTVDVNGNTLTLTLPKAFEKAGRSSLSIDEGSLNVTAGGVTSAYAGTFVYTITGKMAVSDTPLPVEPAAGVTYEGGIPASIDYGTGQHAVFKVSAPDGGIITNVKTMMMTWMQNKGGIMDASGTIVSTGTYAKTQYALVDGSIYFYNNGKQSTTDPMSLNPGTYYFYIPAGCFTYEVDGVTYSNPEIKHGPFVIAAANAKYTFDPENGSTLNEIDSVTLTFDEGSTVAFVDVYTQTVTIKNGTILYDIDATIDGNKVTVAPRNPLTVAGEYEVEFPSLLVNGNRVTPEVTKYTVVPPYVTEMTLTVNGETVNATKQDENSNAEWEVSVSIPEGQEMFITFELPAGFDELYYLDNNANIGGQDGPQLLTISYIPAKGEEGLESAGFTLAVDNKIPVKYGMNSLSIAYAANGEATYPTLLEVNVDNSASGVESVEATEAAEYFTLQGVKVLNPENGIYIKVQNGKATKVIVK